MGEIGAGLLVLLGLDQGDDQPAADRMLDRILAYRVFADGDGRMNLSVADVNGGVLLVSQFTLSADTGRGLRPGFSRALAPAQAEVALRVHAAGFAAPACAGRRGCVRRGYAGQPHQ